MSSTALLLMVLILAAVVVVLAVLLLRRKQGAAALETTVYSSLQHMRSIGQLSVFKVVTKEIVTETDHTWGAFGAKYLGWVMSRMKMAMIFEFEIDFRYDLRRPEFEIASLPGDAYRITMPPCFYEAHIRDIRFYDEQKSRLLPWLLPDLLNAFFAGGFSEENKNRLVVAAKGHAEQQALELIESLQSEVQNAAKATLESISRAFGASEVTFDFLPQGEIKLQVGVSGKAA